MAEKITDGKFSSTNSSILFMEYSLAPEVAKSLD